MTGARPHTQHAPRTAPEKAVQRACTNLLHALGFTVSDFSQPRASMQTPGVPDIHAMHPKYGALWIECKSATGRTSPAQGAWHAAARAAGQTVVIARSAADLIPLLRSLGAPVSDAR